MATTEILPFAGSATGTDILTQSAYSTDSQRHTGNVTGVARRALVNKVLKQSSLLAASLAKFIADHQGTAVVDTLSETALAVMLENALTSFVGSGGGGGSGVGDILFVSNVAAMKAITDPSYNYVITLGYYSAYDGGTGIYKRDTSDTTSAENGITVFVSTNGVRCKLITPYPDNVRQCGVVGNGVADDSDKLQAAINFYKVVQNPTAIGSLENDVYRVLDFDGCNCKITYRMDFADLYYFKICNGQIIADATASWGGDPLLYIARPQATDMYRGQRIRHVTIENMKIHGNLAANGIYLENTYGVTLRDCSVMGWPTGGNGYGIATSLGSAIPNVKNSHLLISNVTVGQHELSYSIDGDGYGVKLQSADSSVEKLTVFKAQTCILLDECYNVQIVDLHTFCVDTNYCMIVGPGMHNLSVTNFYSDTGIVLIQSWHTVFSSCIFVASSKVRLEAQVANETGAGLIFSGCIMAQPQFTEIVGASWVTKGRKIQFLGTSTEFSGKVQGQWITAHGTGRMALDADNSIHIIVEDKEVVEFNDTQQAIFAEDGVARNIKSEAAKVQIHGKTTDTSLNISAWGANNQGPSVNLAKSRSATVGTFGGFPQASDVLGKIDVSGDNGTTFDSGGGRIIFQANENWTATANGTRIRFFLTPIGAAAQATFLTMENTAITPYVDTAVALGGSSNNFLNMYSQNIVLKPPASVTPANNGEMTFELTSNTQLKIKVKGSDGVVRSTSLTLA